jgi:hypothetical protein
MQKPLHPSKASRSFAPLLSCRSKRLGHGLFFGVCLFSAAGCGLTVPAEPEWPAVLKQWYTRAFASYSKADSADADLAIERALHEDAQRPEVRLLAAQIALAKLDYPAVLAHTEGLRSPEAHGLRARAHWYAGELDAATEELELLLSDPQVRDPWAQGVLQLSRQGHGRSPFEIKGSRLAACELTSAANAAMVVPVELNGQPVLGLISTGSPEVVVDSAGVREPSWVTLRFDKRFEVKDVPVLTQDLSGISRELKRPIKVLLGVNLLRRLNATFDLIGQQFVVRSYDPPEPPAATRLPVQYLKGGGMVVRSSIGSAESAPAFSLFVDSAASFSMLLDDDAWKRTGTDADRFLPVAGSAGVKQARLNHVRLGAYTIPSVPALTGEASEPLEKVLGVDLDGRIGAGLLGSFRLTFTDRGRALWLEDLASALVPASQPADSSASLEGTANE